jgi:hypothetical protein
MQEKIYDEIQHWGEQEDYTEDNLRAYEIFKDAIESIVEDKDFIENTTKEEIIENLKYELESLKEELR